MDFNFLPKIALNLHGPWLIYEFRCLSDIKVLTFFFQLNKMSVGVDINSFDKYGRTIVCHFAAKCPR